VLIDRRSEEDARLTKQQVTPTWQALPFDTHNLFLLHTRQTNYVDWKGDRKFNTAPKALSEASQRTWTVASLRDWDTPIPLEMCREYYWWSLEVLTATVMRYLMSETLRTTVLSTKVLEQVFSRQSVHEQTGRVYQSIWLSCEECGLSFQVLPSGSS